MTVVFVAENSVDHLILSAAAVALVLVTTMDQEVVIAILVDQGNEGPPPRRVVNVTPRTPTRISFGYCCCGYLLYRSAIDCDWSALLGHCSDTDRLVTDRYGAVRGDGGGR